MKDFDEGKDEYTDKLNASRNELKDLQNNYQQAKDSIEFARTEEERAFWQRRADGYCEEKDKKDFEIEKLIQKNKNNMSEFDEGSDEGMDVMPETSECVEDTSDVDNLPEGSDDVPPVDDVTEENGTDALENDTDAPVEDDTASDESDELPPEDDVTDVAENDADTPEDGDTVPDESDELPPEDDVMAEESTDVAENDTDAPVEDDTASQESDDVPPGDDAVEENAMDTHDADQADVEDESQLSVSELRARSEAEAAQKQAEFGAWAEEHDVNTFSDGTPMQGHEDDMYTRTPADVEAMEREGMMEKMRYDEMKKAQAAEASEDEADTEEDTEDNTENQDTGTESVNEDVK